MKKLLPVLLLLVTSFTLTAQLSVVNCGNGRYTNDVFTNVTKTSDIIFGYNTTTDYSTGTVYNQTLRLDFYEPAGDPAVQRPLIIVAFGGAFVTGERGDMDSICIALAKKGYAAATIDYRLIYPSFANYLIVGTSSSLLMDEVIKASADMKAAIRFFKRDAATIKTYRIDTTKMIIGGGGSGAIAAMQAAYADNINEYPALTTAYNNNGGFEGNTDLPAPNNLRPAYTATGIAGVINIAGAVLDTNLIDANNPPVYSAQGSADEVNPYNSGQFTVNGTPVPLFLYGSNLIRTRANNVGLKNELYTIAGGDHQSPAMQPHISKIIADASAFVQSIVCSFTLPVTLNSFNVNSSSCTAVLSWQTVTEHQGSRYDIESSADGIQFTKIGTVNSRNAANGASYTYKPEGYRQPALFRLKMVDKDGSFTYSPVQRFTPHCGPSLQVFPNPAHSLATVSGLGISMQVNIISAEGKLLWSQKAAGSSMQIPLVKFANGLLLVQVKDGSGKVLTNARLIKN